jgi:uncharacterized protein (DUF927 family)
MNNDINAQNGYSGNYTEFSGQPFSLKCGDYECNKKIYFNDGKKGFCFPHPITISKIIQNINQNTEKIELAFKRRNNWQRIIIDKDVIATSKSITKLSLKSILVTDDNAKGLVQYLHLLEVLNEDTIPIMDSVSNFGYIEGKGFVPYYENIEFDRKTDFKSLYESITQKGNYVEWVKKIRSLMNFSKYLNTVICSSFASVLLKPMNGNPFYVHLYSTESGTGKTVALHIAGSVWGNPENYKTTFNSTVVGLELYASVLNQLPLLIDEFQLQNDDNNQKHFNPYLLTNGTSKNRATKELGLCENYKWYNTIITNGESPLSNMSGGAGEHNRIVEFEIDKLTDLFPSESHASEVSDFINEHHGHAGRKFVEWLYSDKKHKEEVDYYLKSFKKKLIELGITGKQSRSGAFILTANKLLVKYTFFNDNDTDMFDYSTLLLTPEWLAEYLKTEQKIDITTRAYDIICDWIALNRNKFIHRYIGKDYDTGAEKEFTTNVNGDLFGEYDRTDIENVIVYINKSIFDKVCKENKFDSRSILSGLKRKNLIKCAEKRLTISKRIDNVSTRVVCLFVK